MHTYRIYGSIISSSIPLSESFLKVPGQPELRIERVESIDHADSIEWFHTISEDEVLSRFGQFEGCFYIELPDLCLYKISKAGSEIYFTPQADLSLSEQQGLLLTQILPLALSLRGKLVLHASAVKLGGKAICFLGEQGMGKSTLAAACSAAGLDFLSDDALVVNFEEGISKATAAYLEARIDPKAADFIFKNSVERTPMFSKVRIPLSQSLSEDAVEIGCLYILAESDKVMIQDTSTSEVLETVLSNSFRIDIFNKAASAEEFAKLSSLFETVPVRILSYPRELESLGEVIEAIKTA